MKKQVITGLFLILTFFSVAFYTNPVPASKNQASAATWTPTTPDEGDTLTITYDPSIGTLSESSESISLLWGMYVDGNNDIVMPSPGMWPEGTTQPTISGLPLGRFVESPMTDSGGIWSVSFDINEMPEYLQICFTDGTDRDRNSGDYWIINTVMKDNRILGLSPSYGTPSFLLQGESLPIVVKGPSSATNWDVKLIRGASTVNFTVDNEVYDDGIWNLIVNNDSILAEGLYDMEISATVSSITRTNIQHHSVSVIPEFKENFTFIHISDPQIYPDGSGAQSGKGNVTDMFDFLDTTDAEYIICTGDVTEWTDEISHRNFKKWQLERLDKPMFLIPGNHDEFEGTGESGSNIMGGGQGTYMQIIGPMKHAWSYGGVSHVFFFTDDRMPEEDDITWAETQMAKHDFQEGVTRILMSHHPLDAAYADETVTEPSESRLLNDLKTYNVTHYLHGHLHVDWHHYLDGVHHICAPQTYPFNNEQDLGGYIQYNVTQGNITSWQLYIDGVATDIQEPSPPASTSSTTTTTATSGTPGFTWFISLVAAPVLVILSKKKRDKKKQKRV